MIVIVYIVLMILQYNHLIYTTFLTYLIHYIFIIVYILLMININYRLNIEIKIEYTSPPVIIVNNKNIINIKTLLYDNFIP